MKFPGIVAPETEKVVQPGSPGPPRGYQEDPARAHPDLHQDLGNENGWGIGVSVQLVTCERKRVYHTHTAGS
ncbi:hypothetical protein DPMN_096561 [Dreissena polymorpha]|uniref:Uncharacterized protein n=1 Tax=Dreissena polymorpha TaxID=45954 RepID=A0A9D4LBB4_DREPO|nr:hypothetical protein DPMN_096561 [Dreissena polymorpha]